eukprot:CAMPEP_0205831402 /NCGR_PEP_ID=MMETSP0206-20130828/43984_1 /ASSEMBLY_ACC=CAM_ASM_000279 /TAXON_ID=36767 /ORGANISM="Euplotes focardii, Strain TN1" /LENGTH=364 /DNA_ID=CAMNT_0053135999 /DNA_START=15 /DNA_END=1107 /DNA_ORIENTATION=-
MAGIRDFYLPGDASPELIRSTMEEWGVAVLVRHFSAEQAEDWKRRCIAWLIGLSDGKLKQTAQGWKEEYLPAGPRSGMYQSLFSNAPPVWEMREALYPLFKEIYEEPALLTSLDGGSIYPVGDLSSGRDWAHLDQTVTDLLCVQGQVVMSDSLAGFRCTPTSHKLHERFLDICNRRGDKSNWLLFNAGQLSKVKPLIREDLWQLPIHAPAGSVILWRSTTIHSSVVSPVLPAMKDLADQWANEAGDGSAKRGKGFGFRGWRAVCYISMQPKERFAPHEVHRLKDAALTGRMTNHWATKIFPLKYKGAKCEEIAALLKDPRQVALAREELSPLCRQLKAATNGRQPPLLQTSASTAATTVKYTTA